MAFVSIDGVQLEVRLIANPADNNPAYTHPIDTHPATTGRAPVVFLHEGLGSVSAWTQRGLDWPLAVCTASHRAGVVYSRRGYGQSDPAPGQRPHLSADYLHAEAFNVLPALLAALNIQRPVLLGHSDGASIALLCASRQRVAACIAMAPHVVVEPIALAAIAQARLAFESTPPDGQPSLRSALARHHADVDGAFWQWNDVWLSEGFSTFDIRPQCRRIDAPLLLIQGEQDAYGTLAQLDHIAQAVAPRSVQQLRLADCGHAPHRDQAEACVAAIARFLQDLD